MTSNIQKREQVLDHSVSLGILTFGEGSRDPYDVPVSPAKRPSTWRPWDSSQSADSLPQGSTQIYTPVGHAENSNSSRSRTSQGQATPRPRIKYLQLIQAALENNLANGLTINGIVDWLRTNRATTYSELGGDTLRQGIRIALSQQKNRRNRKVWECEDKKWRLSGAFVTEQPMEEPREGDPSTPSASVNPSTEGPSTLDTDEGICRPESPQAQDIRSPNGQHVPSAAAVHQLVAAPASIPEVDAQNQCLSNSIQLPERTDPETDAYAAITVQLSQAPTLVDQSARNRADEGAQSYVLPLSDAADEGVVTGLDKGSSQDQQHQNPDIPCSGIDGENPREPEHGSASTSDAHRLGEIVQKLRKMTEDRKTREQKIEADRSALPDIKALTEKTEKARVRLSELALLLEEAQRSTQVMEKALEEGLAKRNQLAKDEQSLTDLHRDYNLVKSQLHID